MTEPLELVANSPSPDAKDQLLSSQPLTRLAIRNGSTAHYKVGNPQWIDRAGKRHVREILCQDEDEVLILVRRRQILLPAAVLNCCCNSRSCAAERFVVWSLHPSVPISSPRALSGFARGP